LTRRLALAVLGAALAAASCHEKPAAPVAVRNPDYLVARPIRREADAEHTIQVDLPMAGGGFGFAASTPLLDMASFDLGGSKFLGGRTSTVGAAALWVPLKPEANPRLEEWSARAASNGELLGLFLKGKLVAAPRMKTAVGGGIVVPVASKDEGDAVLKELRNGGAP
jgi:hypothetical protein